MTDPRKNAPDTYSTICSELRHACSSAHCRMDNAAPTPAKSALATTSGKAADADAPAAPGDATASSYSSTDATMHAGATITTARRRYSGASFRAATTHTMNTGSIPRLMRSWPNHGLSG